MAYPEILRDKRKAAIPQLWDGSNWRPLKGTKDGHQQTQLVGPDGQPIGSENPLEVRVRELEEKLDAMNQLLQSGDAKMQLTGSLAQGGDGARHFTRTGNLAASTQETLLDTGVGKSIEIITFELVGNHNNLVRISIGLYGSDGIPRYLGIMHPAGFSNYFTFNLVESFGSSIVENTKYDTGANQFKLVMRPGVRIQAPNGVRVLVINADSVEHVANAMVVVREVVA